MESVILNIAIASCIISALFVLARVYYVYFADRKCSDDCECDKQKDLADAVVAAVNIKVAKIKPKRIAKPKATSTAPTEPVAKKKPGRKKKS